MMARVVISYIEANLKVLDLMTRRECHLSKVPGYRWYYGVQ